LVSGIGVGLLAVGLGQACECEPPQPVRKEFDNSSAVFTGNVVSIRHQNGSLVATIRVVEVFKGSLHVDKLTDVRTRPTKASCGFPFEPGVGYLVYARLSERKQLSTSACSRTIWFPRAEAELPDLREITGKTDVGENAG